MRHYIGRAYGEVTQSQKFDYTSAVFVDCSFTDMLSEGAEIDAVFVRCRFIKVDWYWCIGHGAIFIECQFSDCDLRGSFYCTSFVGCRFDRCNAGENNLGGATKWDNCLATDCVFVDTILPIISLARSDR